MGLGSALGAPPVQRPLEGDYVIHDFRFASGETLPELRLHYTYLGKARKDSAGRVTNAVLVMHGTGGSGRSLINDRFSGVLFQKGQLLDAENITTASCRTASVMGNPASSSDGLHARFPQ